MTTPKDQYISEIREKFGYTPTWLPIVTVSPGDIVLLDDDSPTPIGTLRNDKFGVPIEIRDDGPAADIHHTSADGVSIAFKAEGAAPLPNSVLSAADAGVSIELTRKNAVVLEAIGCSTKRIAEQDALGKKIIDLYRADQWEKEWAVVTEVVYAESLTIILASGSEAKIELKATGEFSAGAASLASAKAKFEVLLSKNLATRIVATKGLTPFYKAYGVGGVFTKHFIRRASLDGEAQSLAELRAKYRAKLEFLPVGG